MMVTYRVFRLHYIIDRVRGSIVRPPLSFTLALSVPFDTDSRDPGTAAQDQKIDFKALGQNQCFDALYTSISQYCEYSPLAYLTPFPLLSVAHTKPYDIYLESSK